MSRDACDPTSKTGTYKYDPDLKQMVKISDVPGQVAFDVAWKGPEWLEIDDQPVFVETKGQKWRELRKRGLSEKGGKDSKPIGLIKYFIPGGR